VSRTDATTYFATTPVKYLWSRPGFGGTPKGKVSVVSAYLNTTDIYSDVVEDDPDHTYGSNSFTWTPQNGDIFYTGFDAISPISATDVQIVYFGASPLNGGGATGAYEYWNGSAWTAVSVTIDSFIYFSLGGGSSSALTFTNPSDWARTQVNSDGRDLFYFRVRIISAAFPSGDPVVDAVEMRARSVNSNVDYLGTQPPLNLTMTQPLDSGSGWYMASNPAFLPNDVNSDLFLDSYSWRFSAEEIDNTELEISIGPAETFDYSDEFAITAGYFFAQCYRGDVTSAATGSYPDQLGWGWGFNYNYKGTLTSREIHFLVRDETSALGPYLELYLYDNDEAAPDNRGVPTGERFVMRDPATGDPWRWPARDNTIINSTDSWRVDKNTRFHLVGFSLQRSFTPQGDEYWTCSFYHNGRYVTVQSEIGIVPHEILHQTPNPGFMWNMYDDGSGEPFLSRTHPHMVCYPFLGYTAFSKAQFDGIHAAFLKQTSGVSGHYSIVIPDAPPERGLDHESSNFGRQVRGFQHTHTTEGNARYVPPVITTRFRLTITGIADATTDVQVPMRSFNTTSNVGEQQTASFVIPYRDTLIDALNERPNGTIVLEYSLLDAEGGSPNFVNYFTATRSDTQVYRGAQNSSIVLLGDYVLDTPGTTTHELSQGEIQREVIEAGVHSVTAEFDPTIQPGDTVNYTTSLGAESFVIRQIQVEASTLQTVQMILMEAGSDG
jgi:hypothetical protein